MSEESKELTPKDGQDLFVVQCHCGQVRGKFVCNSEVVEVIDCNCSDCGMRKNAHLTVPASDFALDLESNTKLEDVTTLYQWGTKTATRRFCKTCGVLPWYNPRSKPDGVAITVHCVDWTKGGTRNAPEMKYEHYDGTNWEKAFTERKKRSEGQ